MSVKGHVIHYANATLVLLLIYSEQRSTVMKRVFELRSAGIKAACREVMSNVFLDRITLSCLLFSP